MNDLGDDALKWLIERSHNAYLTFIGLWLACMLGMVNVLLGIASNSGVLSDHKILAFCMYALLVLGMNFAVYRIGNILKEHIGWGKQIKKETALKKEIVNHRGTLSKFVVDDDGNLCRRNRNFVMALQLLFTALLFLLAVFPN